MLIGLFLRNVFTFVVIMFTRRCFVFTRFYFMCGVKYMFFSVYNGELLDGGLFFCMLSIVLVICFFFSVIIKFFSLITAFRVVLINRVVGFIIVSVFVFIILCVFFVSG